MRYTASVWIELGAGVGYGKLRLDLASATGTATACVIMKSTYYGIPASHRCAVHRIVPQ